LLITSDDDWNTVWTPPSSQTATKAAPRKPWLKPLVDRAGRAAVASALVAMVLMGAFSAGLGAALILGHFHHH
jgi:hypothetical protein